MSRIQIQFCAFVCSDQWTHRAHFPLQNCHILSLPTTFTCLIKHFMFSLLLLKQYVLVPPFPRPPHIFNGLACSPFYFSWNWILLWSVITSVVTNHHFMFIAVFLMCTITTHQIAFALHMCNINCMKPSVTFPIPDLNNCHPDQVYMWFHLLLNFYFVNILCAHIRVTYSYMKCRPHHLNTQW